MASPTSDQATELSMFFAHVNTHLEITNMHKQPHSLPLPPLHEQTTSMNTHLIAGLLSGLLVLLLILCLVPLYLFHSRTTNTTNTEEQQHYDPITSFPPPNSYGTIRTTNLPVFGKLPYPVGRLDRNENHLDNPGFDINKNQHEVKDLRVALLKRNTFERLNPPGREQRVFGEHVYGGVVQWVGVSAGEPGLNFERPRVKKKRGGEEVRGRTRVREGERGDGGMGGDGESALLLGRGGEEGGASDDSFIQSTF